MIASLLRQSDAAPNVPEAGVGAESVNSQVSLNEVCKIRRSLLICLLQKFKCLVFLA